MSSKTANKFVTISNETIPGKSYENLKAIKKDIAIFAKKHELENIEIFDPRKLLVDDEFVPASVENKLAGMVGVLIKNKMGKVQTTFIDYWKNKDTFTQTFYNKLNEIVKKLNANK